MAKTEYVILRGSPDEESVGTLHLIAGQVTASSATEAIKATATTSGAYVAVPLRSFKPVSVIVETKPSVQIGELA